uniref:DUF6754 domain-containing protein n=1 Tax=uncultured Chloroflexota bacterium TaxID=166587 RepID=Q2Z022_9CHLR|nr:hypothetical protein [uncultured Chloroflexota bacterium]
MNPVLESLEIILGLLLLALALTLTIFFLMREFDRGPGVSRRLRDIPAFHRFRRAIGLSVESGQRLHISLGRGGVMDLPGGATLEGLTILECCTRAASVSDRPPVVTSGESITAVLSQDTLRLGYASLGAERRYTPTNGRLSGLTPLSYAAGVMPDIHDEQVSASIFAGHFGSEIGLLIEAGERTNGLTVAGSDSLPAQAVLYATAQEPLIGEELYAGGAYLGAGKAHVASLYMQDILRWVVIGLIFLGAIFKLVGVWP